MRAAKRLDRLPPYLFAEIEARVAEKKAAGVDLIDLGIGDPDGPSPKRVVDRLCAEAQNPDNHHYPSYFGLPAFRASIAQWYKQRFDVELDPETEVLPLIGSKEGIAHVSLALLDPGDTALIPEPGYPVYNTGCLLAGGEPLFLPLLEENGFVPDLRRLTGQQLSGAKTLFLNYPNNPTAAVAGRDFFNDVVSFAADHDLAVLHDFAYSEITFDRYRAVSFLQADGAKEVGLEFHSLSKTYNMTGWRVGFAVGNRRIVEALGKVKTNVDSGIFDAIQKAGIEALEEPTAETDKRRLIYERRRDLVMAGLKKAGLGAVLPAATIYVWAKVPEGYSSSEFTSHVLDRASVVVSPGRAYGPSGEGYYRISLSVPEPRLQEALDRIAGIL